MKNDNFEQSHSAEKSERETLWDFQSSIMFQNIKKTEGGTLWYDKKFSINSIMRKQSKLETTRYPKWRSLVVFKVLHVGFVILDGVLRFAICFGQTEQKNKKVDLPCLKKLLTVRVGHTFY